MATFSVNDSVRRAVASGNGSNKNFAFSFQINQASDIKIYVDGVVKTEGSGSTNYVVQDGSGNAGLSSTGTGTVVFGTAPANGTAVTILSDIPLARSSLYSAGGNVTATALENDFDILTMALGDREERDTRSLQAPVNDPIDINMTMPKKADRLGKMLGFNSSTGNPEAVDSTISSASVTSTTTGSSGSNASVSASFNAGTGNVAFAFTIPQGTTGTQGSNGVFSAIASQAEANAGTENTKGMTALRTKQAITHQVSAVNVSSNFYGISSNASGDLTLTKTTTGGSEAFTLSDYPTYFLGAGSVSASVNASGHLLINLP